MYAELEASLKRLMAFRVVMVTTLLLIATYVEINSETLLTVNPLYFVIGADSFEDLPLWRDYLRLVESCHIIVTARPGYRLDAAHLAEAARRKLVDLRGTDPGDVPPRPPGAGTAIYLTDDAFVDVSATAVRERARRGEPLTGMVPDAVAEYIQKQELYDTKPDE